MICPKCFDKGERIEMVEESNNIGQVCRVCPDCGHKEGKGAML
jgi:hypothetical protein